MNSRAKPAGAGDGTAAADAPVGLLAAAAHASNAWRAAPELRCGEPDRCGEASRLPVAERSGGRRDCGDTAATAG